MRISCDCDAAWWFLRNSYSQISELIAPINTGGLTPLCVSPLSSCCITSRGPLLWKHIMSPNPLEMIDGMVSSGDRLGLKQHSENKITIELCVVLMWLSVVLWQKIIDIVSWCESSMSETTATAVLVESVVVPAVVMWLHNSSQYQAPRESVTNISEQLNCVTHHHHEWKIQTLLLLLNPHDTIQIEDLWLYSTIIEN